MRISEIENPTNMYFTGNWAPVQEQHNELCTEVIGTIPEDLQGSFLRIGANPVFVNDKQEYHAFSGDGMVHEVAFKDGKATYINRFVETEGHLAEQEYGDIIWDGFNTPPELAAKYGPSKNIANTAMVYHAGKVFALQEGSMPFEVTLPNLDPVGEYNYAGKLDYVPSAHPKIDENTGEIFTNHDATARAQW